MIMRKRTPFAFYTFLYRYRFKCYSIQSSKKSNAWEFVNMLRAGKMKTFMLRNCFFLRLEWHFHKIFERRNNILENDRVKANQVLDFS